MNTSDRKQIELLSAYRPTGSVPMCKELTVFLRQQIRTGALKSGEKLPPLRALSKILKVNYFTLQLVTDELMKEGLLRKYHAKGMYVASPKTGIRCVGIYLSRVPQFRQDEMFYAVLREMLCRKLHDRGIDYVIWDDVRPQEKHDFPPDYITSAIVENQVQGVVGLQLRDYDRRWFMRLQTRIFTFENFGFKDNMLVEPEEWQKIAKQLQARDCRRIAVLVPDEHVGGHHFLIDDLKNVGVKLMPRYQRVISQEEYLSHSLGELGYSKTLDLLTGSPKPDALIVFPDHAVLGAIQAILQCGVQVPDQLFPVFHRNVELDYFCQFKATYLDVRITGICDSLMNQILS